MYAKRVVPAALALAGMLLTGCEPGAPVARPTATPTLDGTATATATTTAPSPTASAGAGPGETPSPTATTGGPTPTPTPRPSRSPEAGTDDGGPVGDPSAVRTQDTRNGRLYLVPGFTESESDRAYRYIGIVTGSEPGENGHPGLDAATRKTLLAELPTIVSRVATDFGGRGLVPADGKVSTFEAYAAEALGSTLYRPFYAKNAGIDDSYGRNWQENLRQLVKARGGISRDTLQMMLDRVADGQPIARHQNGAREVFGGAGSQFQPYDLRNDKTFSRAPNRLADILKSPMD